MERRAFLAGGLALLMVGPAWAKAGKAVETRAQIKGCL